MFLNHKWEDHALKSPEIIDKDDLRLLISFNSFWKSVKIDFLARRTIDKRYYNLFIVVTHL